MIKYVGCKIGEEYEILKYSAMEWITKDHKTEREQKLPSYGRWIIQLPGL